MKITFDLTPQEWNLILYYLEPYEEARGVLGTIPESQKALEKFNSKIRSSFSNEPIRSA
tara:strand:- start:559 stop:735 length:177 start_codon:yes stop_codon:yes gene_type:complete